jgi:hypothetical protein
VLLSLALFQSYILINFCPFENAYDFILSMLRGGEKLKNGNMHAGSIQVDVAPLIKFCRQLIIAENVEFGIRKP